MVFNKSFGQHILINSHILQEMVQKSGIKPTDIVLEIGPGTGNLTQLLLERARKVIAIQIDPRMIAELTKRFKYTQLGPKLELIGADVLSLDLPYFDVCVANIPYQISSPLTFKLLAQKPAFRCAVIMFQKEFAQRLIAKPGSDLYCRLSVNVQLLARVDHLIKVGKNNFKPPPKVESSIVRIEPRIPLPDIDFIQWDALLRLCFTRKNKTLAAAFKHKSVLALLAQNHLLSAPSDLTTILQTLSLTDAQQDHLNNMEAEGDASNDEGEGEIREEQASKSSALAEMKCRVLKVLEDTNCSTKRSSKMGIQDFLLLLCTFNKAGVFFR